MPCPALLSLEYFRDTHRRAAIRQRLHDRFDRGLNQLEDHMQDPTPALAEPTQAVFALRQVLTQAVTEPSLCTLPATPPRSVKVNAS